MREIIIDGYIMDTKEKAHSHIREKLGSEEYHGSNLDALWDVLTTYSQVVTLALINKTILIDNLGEYGQDLIKVFQDASIENNNINFVIID